MPTPDKNDEKNAEATPKGERELNVEDVEAEGEDVKGGGIRTILDYHQPVDVGGL